MNAISLTIFWFFLAVIVWILWRDSQKRIARKKAFDAHLLELASSVLEDVKRSPKDGFGTYSFEGKWRDEHVQIRFIIDNLAVRKLPVLWLSLSMFGKTGLDGVYDLMNRPAGLNSFSNFSELPFVLSLPEGFAGQVELRSDHSHMGSDIVPAGRLHFMHEPHAKEFLATPKGVRLVWTLQEADRVRYGVMRNADFGDIELHEDWLNLKLESLQCILDDLREREMKYASE